MSETVAIIGLTFVFSCFSLAFVFLAVFVVFGTIQCMREFRKDKRK